MRRTRRNEILSSAYRSRILANEALDAAVRGVATTDSLNVAAEALDATAGQFPDPAPQARYRLTATLVKSVAFLVNWIGAVRKAEIEADRFLRSAKVFARDALVASEMVCETDRIRDISTRIAELTEIDEIAPLARSLLCVPLPLPIFTDWRRPHSAEGTSAKSKKPDVVVAFTSFQVNGIPFGDPQTIQPEVMHDLKVNVAVSEWPEEAKELVLEPASVEPSGTYDLPGFRFERPKGTPPYSFTKTGRLLVKYPTALYARPLEFAYRAWFSPEVDRVLVRGHRHLRVQSFDPEHNPQSGYAEVDRRIFELRDEVRRVGTASDTELNSFFLILSVLGGIAAEALQDHLFPRKYSESEFQAEMKKLLRLNRRIGSQLEEHPRAAGGITDLSFHRIRLELKAENEKFVSEQMAMQYVPQTAQYVAGSDRRFGALCIFDGSPKCDAPGLVANDIFVKAVLPPGGNGVPIRIGVVIVRGNLAKPSDLSRKPPAK